MVKTKHGQRHDEVAVLEAAYRTDGAETDWAEGLARAAAPLLDQGVGVTVGTGEIHPDEFRVRGTSTAGGSERLHHVITGFVTHVDQRMIIRAFRYAAMSTFSVACGGPGRLEAEAESAPLFDIGIRDAIGVVGLDDTRYTVMRSTFLQSPTKLSKGRLLAGSVSPFTWPRAPACVVECRPRERPDSPSRKG